MLIVFGSLNMDVVVRVKNLPSPGETVVGNTYTLTPGGKGANQAVAASRMGSQVCLFGSVGNDEWGERLIEELNGIDAKGIEKNCNSSTGCAYITVDSSGENQIAVASGANFCANSSIVPDSFLNEASVLLLQMEVNPEENWKLIRRINKNTKKAKICLNLAPVGSIPKDVLQCIDILFMNSMESNWLSNDLGMKIGDPELIAEFIGKTFNMNVVITLGSKGAVGFNNNRIFKVDAIKVNPTDTTAAGDACVGTFASFFDQGYDFETCLRAGVISGTLSTLKSGAQSSFPTKKEVDNRLLLFCSAS